MINRWCVVGEPRCGSHWLESKLTPSLGLGEFFNYYFYNADHQYMYYKNNFICPLEEFSTDKLTREEFFQKRISQIKKINPLQQLTLILFCNNPSTDYTPIIKTLDQCNFKFIVLERNLFDRVLSSCVADITKIAHRWKIRPDLPSADSLGSISIDREVWINTLFKEYQTTEYRKSLLSNYNCLTVRFSL
jgi:hypothetical protein